MPKLKVERNLRQAVAQLQRFGPVDFDAVLGALAETHRARVLALFAEHEGQRLTDCAGQPRDGNNLLNLSSGLSAWLVARINGRGDGDETADNFCMTAHAHRTLRECAQSLVPQPPQPRHAPSLLARLTARMA